MHTLHYNTSITIQLTLILFTVGVFTMLFSIKRQLQVNIQEAYSGTLSRREIVRVNASLGEIRRDKEKLSSPIGCELKRVKAS